MSDTVKEFCQGANWNVLTSPWLKLINQYAVEMVYSPLDALRRAREMHCLAFASPLDFFSAHRFLLTLLYWKADEAGGVQKVRGSLLRDEVPQEVLESIEKEEGYFRMFDETAPFLQDPSAQRKTSTIKSVGSLFAEFATGSNIAHFHHGDDKNMRLCLRCATIGMLRIVPWTQSGGQGLTPSIHGAPPIVAIASGNNLANTLGLNLVPLTGVAGTPMWTGYFKPTAKDRAIPYMEAFTWNPRRIRLSLSQNTQICWGCGQPGSVVESIVYMKNEETKKTPDKKSFMWKDPAAFYTEGNPYKTMKSTREELAVKDCDLLFSGADFKAAVCVQNPDHQSWYLVIPCTGSDNKTFDHRQLELTNPSLDMLHNKQPDNKPTGFDGWKIPLQKSRSVGSERFVLSAVRHLMHSDWVVLSSAAYLEMQESPAAFDILTGLLWPLRRTVKGLPSPNVAWLVLKLMAAVPSRARIPRADATFCLLRSLLRRQPDERHQGRTFHSPYPVSFPRGQRLEAALRSALDSNMRRRMPEKVDWAGLCFSLDRLL
ncbi:MAG: type I-E CRISPR-associated protein Cse1/CasA [Candidatus Glassbacteria bacterium]